MLDYEIVSENAHFLQGDIFKKVKSAVSPTYVILISADCDIANNKLPKAGLACIELTPLHQYILYDHAYNVVTRQIKKKTDKLVSWLNDKWIKKDPSNLEISITAILQMIESDSIKTIEGNFGIVPTSKKSYLEIEIECIRNAKKIILQQNKFSALDALVALQTNGSRADQLKTLFSNMEPDNLPIDVFFISALPGECDVGYIAKLKSLSFIPVDKCFSSLAKARDSDEAFLRICRLTSTFRHGLAQQFGMLFARIGYPTEYETNRDLVFTLNNNEILSEIGNTND